MVDRSVEPTVDSVGSWAGQTVALMAVQMADSADLLVGMKVGCWGVLKVDLAGSMVGQSADHWVG